MKRWKCEAKVDLFQVLCLVVILGAGGWLISQRFPLIPHEAAESAMKDTISHAADEARDVADRVLHRNDSSGGTPDASDPAANPLKSPDDLLRLGAGLAHEFSRIGDDAVDEVMGLTVQEEIEVGGKVHEQIVADSELLDRSADLQRIERVAAPFLQARSRKEIPYRFSIIKEDQINAFAHIGGYVYITSGLLDALTDDDELRFVVGHEIAHSDLRHCAKGVTAMVRAEEVAGGLGGMIASMAYRAVAVGYSEELEFEADSWAYRQMIRADRSPSQALAGLRLLERHYGDLDETPGHTSTGSVIDQIKDHLKTHPPIRERIDRLEQRQGE